jgi:hypothetical protein|tara:strand:+ start:224 stop:358 length:135 start_codon:yes stop_codon:yes gene_type:complete
MPDYGRASLMQAYVMMVVVFGLCQRPKNPFFRLPLEGEGEVTKS